MAVATYDRNDEPIVLSKAVMDLLLGQPYYCHLLALYSFYYYTAKWQKTNQPRCTNAYVMKGTGLKERALHKYKKHLIRLGLIENIKLRTSDGVFDGHYIKVNFIWSHAQSQHFTKDQPTIPAFFHTVVKRSTNALSSNSIKSMSDPAGTDDQMVLPLKPSNRRSPIRKKNITPPKAKAPSKPTAADLNKRYLQFATQLSTIIKDNKNINHSSNALKAWSQQFRLLHTDDGVVPSRFQRALDWYATKAYSDKYIPVIESGDSFRKKYLKLEAAMTRAGIDIKTPKKKIGKKKFYAISPYEGV